MTDAVQEEEAKWLGPSLLVPNEAALYILESNMPLADAAQFYGVSQMLVKMAH